LPALLVFRMNLSSVSSDFSTSSDTGGIISFMDMAVCLNGFMV